MDTEVRQEADSWHIFVECVQEGRSISICALSIHLITPPENELELRIEANRGFTEEVEPEKFNFDKLQEVLETTFELPVKTEYKK